MPDTPVKVVLDCSAQSGLTQTIPAILEQAAEAARAGDVDTTNELLTLARDRAKAAADEPATETISPLSKEEIAQRSVDVAAEMERVKVAADADAQQAALIEKLQQGKATPAEMQQTLAQLLGGSS